MGKREIGELSVIDFIVSLFIAELVAISIENYKDSIWNSLLPILILVSLQLLTAKLSLMSKKIRDVLDGKPSMIIKKGKINRKEMKRLRYNLDDLLSQLREAAISSIEEVEYAVLETNGKLSIFTKTDTPPYPMALILDGKVEEDVLKEIQKSKEWLKKELRKKNIKQKEIFYAFFQDNELFIIQKEEKN